MSATSEETIHATITAVSVAVAAAVLGVGVAASGAGTDAENSIGATIKAYIDGDGSTGITANTVSVTATDSSTIVADSEAASVSVAYGTVGAAALSVGTAIATNTIGNDVEASISNAAPPGEFSGRRLNVCRKETATITTTVVSASAAASLSLASVALSGAGAASTNNITNTVKAFIASSQGVQAADAVNVTATDTPTITATTVAASLAGGLVGISIAALTAHSTVDDNVSAYIDPSQVTANNGNIAVTATSDPNITNTSAAAAVSLSVFGGSGAG